MLKVCAAGLTAATWKNKSAQTKRYLQFTTQQQANPLSPTIYNLLIYLLHLQESLSSPGTVMNYLSGARTWIQLLGGNTKAFDSYQVSLMKRGVYRLSQHTPRQALPLTPSDLQAAIMVLRASGPPAQVLIAALLLGYHTLLRQGNFLTTLTKYDPGHALQARDITQTQTGLEVTVKTTKTRWRPGQSYNVLIPRVPGSPFCPAAAWATYVAHSRPLPVGPAFIMEGGAPLQPCVLTRALRLALAAAGVPNHNDYTLHSMRQGGAQACAASGDSLQDIMELGSWSSKAVHTYVPRDQVRTGPRTLANCMVEGSIPVRQYQEQQ